MQRVAKTIDRGVDGITMLVGVGMMAWALGRMWSVETAVLFVGAAMVTAACLSVASRRRKPMREPGEGAE